MKHTLNMVRAYMRDSDLAYNLLSIISFCLTKSHHLINTIFVLARTQSNTAKAKEDRVEEGI